MANLFYENLPDGMHDVLMGPQEGLFLTGYDSLRRLCLVLYAPPFGQRMRVLSQLPYRDYGRYTPTVLGAHDAPRGALYVLLYQTPISWGIERMSLYRIYPDSGQQVLLSESHAPFWAPTAILPRPDGSVLVGLSGYGPLMRYHGCNDTACAGLDTLDTAASNATGKAGMADISGPDGSSMLCLVVGTDQLLGRSGTVVCEQPDGSLQTIWSEEDGTLVPRGGGGDGGGDDDGGISSRKGADAAARDGAAAATRGPLQAASVSRGRALTGQWTGTATQSAAGLAGGEVPRASGKPGDQRVDTSGVWPGRRTRARPGGELWQRRQYWRAAADEVHGDVGSEWVFNPAWRQPESLAPAQGRARGTGSKGGSSFLELARATHNASLPTQSLRERALSFLHNPSILARGPSVQLAYGGGGSGQPRAADSILIVSRDSMSEFGLEQGSVHALLPREPRGGEECGAAGCWDPPRPLVTSLSNPRGVAVDEAMGKLYVLEQNTLHGSNYELFAGDVLEFCVAGYYDCSSGQNSGECQCAPGFGGACCDTPAGAAGVAAVLATAGTWATFAPPLLAAAALLYFGMRTRRPVASDHHQPSGARGERAMGTPAAGCEAGGAARPSLPGRPRYGSGADGFAPSLQEPLFGAGTPSAPVDPGAQSAREGRSGAGEATPERNVRRNMPWSSPARLAARSCISTPLSGLVGVAGTSASHLRTPDRASGRDRVRDLSRDRDRYRERNVGRGQVRSLGWEGTDSPVLSSRRNSSLAQLYHSMIIHPDTQPTDEAGDSSDSDSAQERMARPTTRTGLAKWLASGFGGMDFLSSPENSEGRAGATEPQHDDGLGPAPRSREL